MREHEFPNGDRFCKWCGALHHAQMTATYLERPAPPTSDLMPEPRRRLLACEAGDAIAAQLAELQREREAALNPPSGWGRGKR